MISEIIDAANIRIVTAILNSLTEYVCNESSPNVKILNDSEVLDYVAELLKYPEHLFNDVKDIEEGIPAELVSEKIVAIHNALRIGDVYIAIGDILNYLPEGPFANKIIDEWSVDIIMSNRKNDCTAWI